MQEIQILKKCDIDFFITLKREFKTPNDEEDQYYADIMTHLGRVNRLDKYQIDIENKKKYENVPEHYFVIPESHRPAAVDKPEVSADSRSETKIDLTVDDDDDFLPTF